VRKVVIQVLRGRPEAVPSAFRNDVSAGSLRRLEPVRPIAGRRTDAHRAQIGAGRKRDSGGALREGPRLRGHEDVSLRGGVATLEFVAGRRGGAGAVPRVLSARPSDPYFCPLPRGALRESVPATDLVRGWLRQPWRVEQRQRSGRGTRMTTFIRRNDMGPRQGTARLRAPHPDRLNGRLPPRVANASRGDPAFGVGGDPRVAGRCLRCSGVCAGALSGRGCTSPSARGGAGSAITPSPRRGLPNRCGPSARVVPPAESPRHALAHSTDRGAMSRHRPCDGTGRLAAFPRRQCDYRASRPRTGDGEQSPDAVHRSRRVTRHRVRLARSLAGPHTTLPLMLDTTGSVTQVKVFFGVAAGRGLAQAAPSEPKGGLSWRASDR
jgi:hypothetical protein